MPQFDRPEKSYDSRQPGHRCRSALSRLRSNPTVVPRRVRRSLSDFTDQPGVDKMFQITLHGAACDVGKHLLAIRERKSAPLQKGGHQARLTSVELLRSRNHVGADRLLTSRPNLLELRLETGDKVLEPLGEIQAASRTACSAE